MLAAVALCLVASLVAFLGPAGAADPPDWSGEQGVALAPDLALHSVGIDDETRARVVGRLGSATGVVRATGDQLGEDEAVFYLAVDELEPLDSVIGRSTRTIADIAPDATVTVGGSALADERLSGRFGTSAAFVVVLAVLIGLAAALPLGLARGGLVAAALGLAVGAAASIGAQAGGGFDGSMTATALPGALAGLVMAVAVAGRLLTFFWRWPGGDGADAIRASVAELVPEVALVLTGLLVSAVLTELAGPGRSPLTVMTVAALVSALVVPAVLAPGLAILGGSGRNGWLVARSIPDGRDLPLLIVSGIALLLIVAAVFGLGATSRSLLDSSALVDDDDVRVVAERLAVSGGDATGAIIALKPAEATQVDFEGWATVAAERPDVELVDVSSGRRRSTGTIATDPTTLLVPPGAEGVAVIVPAVTPRSVDAQDLVAGLTTIPLAGGSPTFEGRSADAGQLVSTTFPLVVAVLSLALAGAVGALVLGQGLAQGAVVLVLRLLGGAATVGLYRLVVPEAGLAEVTTVVGAIAIGVGLYEAEFVRKQADGAAPTPAYHGFATTTGDGPARNGGSPPAADADLGRGQAAAAALVALAISGFAVAAAVTVGGGPGTGRFGFGLMVAAAVELVVGLVLLRPALLGQRAAFHTAARPVRVAIHSGTAGVGAAGAGGEDPTWRRVIEDLLQTEFRLQAEPADADLESVFVRDTPLYRQANTHHTNLASAGLRIVGRSPRLRSLKTVSGRPPITLAVTVDHPARQLVDADGTVVGVRKPERRSGVLWLSDDRGGGFRIAESVELGSVPLPDATGDDGDDPQPAGPGQAEAEHSAP